MEHIIETAQLVADFTLAVMALLFAIYCASVVYVGRDRNELVLSAFIGTAAAAAALFGLAKLALVYALVVL